MPDNQDLVYYHDKFLVRILLICGLVLYHYYRDNKGIVHFGFDPAEAKPIERKYDRNEPIPVLDIRILAISEALYYRALKDTPYNETGSIAN